MMITFWALITPIVIAPSFQETYVLAILSAFFGTWMLFAVNEAASQLEQPFDDADNDLPILYYSLAFQEEISTLLNMKFPSIHDHYSFVEEVKRYKRRGRRFSAVDGFQADIDLESNSTSSTDLNTNSLGKTNAKFCERVHLSEPISMHSSSTPQKKKSTGRDSETKKFQRTGSLRGLFRSKGESPELVSDKSKGVRSTGNEFSVPKRYSAHSPISSPEEPPSDLLFDDASANVLAKRGYHYSHSADSIDHSFKNSFRKSELEFSVSDAFKNTFKVKRVTKKGNSRYGQHSVNSIENYKTAHLDVKKKSERTTSTQQGLSGLYSLFPSLLSSQQSTSASNTRRNERAKLPLHSEDQSPAAIQRSKSKKYDEEDEREDIETGEYHKQRNQTSWSSSTNQRASIGKSLIKKQASMDDRLFDSDDSDSELKTEQFKSARAKNETDSRPTAASSLVAEEEGDNENDDRDDRDGGDETSEQDDNVRLFQASDLEDPPSDLAAQDLKLTAEDIAWKKVSSATKNKLQVLFNLNEDQVPKQAVHETIKVKRAMSHYHLSHKNQELKRLALSRATSRVRSTSDSRNVRELPRARRVKHLLKLDENDAVAAADLAKFGHRMKKTNFNITTSHELNKRSQLTRLKSHRIPLRSISEKTGLLDVSKGKEAHDDSFISLQGQKMPMSNTLNGATGKKMLDLLMSQMKNHQRDHGVEHQQVDVKERVFKRDLNKSRRDHHKRGIIAVSKKHVPVQFLKSKFKIQHAPKLYVDETSPFSLLRKQGVFDRVR